MFFTYAVKEFKIQMGRSIIVRSLLNKTKPPSEREESVNISHLAPVFTDYLIHSLYRSRLVRIRDWSIHQQLPQTQRCSYACRIWVVTRNKLGLVQTTPYHATLSSLRATVKYDKFKLFRVRGYDSNASRGCVTFCHSERNRVIRLRCC